MIRIIVRTTDIGAAANIGGPVHTRYETVDVHCPKLEELMTITRHGIPVIDLYFNAPYAQCCVCGQWDISLWGIPVDGCSGEIVSNDFKGDWGAKPACEQCHDRHATGEFVGQYPKF